MMKRAMLVVVSACAGSIALAQPTNHVSAIKISDGAWVMNPIYADSDPPTVQAFLALADISKIQEGNLVAVLYAQDGTGTWTAKSWMTEDPWEAVKYVKALNGIPDAEDELWSVPASASTDTPSPMDYAGGLMSDDPLAELVSESDDPEGLIQFLVDSGYKAADIKFDKGDCTSGEQLGAAASVVEQLLPQAPEDMDNMFDDVLVAATAGCGGSLAGRVVNIPPYPVGPMNPTYNCSPTWNGSIACTTITWTFSQTYEEKRRCIQTTPVLASCMQYRLYIVVQTCTCQSCGTTAAPTSNMPCPSGPPYPWPQSVCGAYPTPGWKANTLSCPSVTGAPNAWAPACALCPP